MATGDIRLSVDLSDIMARLAQLDRKVDLIMASQQELDELAGKLNQAADNLNAAAAVMITETEESRQASAEIRAAIQALRDAGADVSAVQAAANRLIGSSERMGQASVDMKSATDDVQAIPRESGPASPAST